jgi:hypothetical protein
VSCGLWAVGSVCWKSDANDVTEIRNVSSELNEFGTKSNTTYVPSNIARLKSERLNWQVATYFIHSKCHSHLVHLAL